METISSLLNNQNVNRDAFKVNHPTNEYIGNHFEIIIRKAYQVVSGSKYDSINEWKYLQLNTILDF